MIYNVMDNMLILIIMLFVVFPLSTIIACYLFYKFIIDSTCIPRNSNNHYVPNG